MCLPLPQPSQSTPLTPHLSPSRYQFNPELYNPDVVINILIKALTSAPFPDFSLCISLLDERPAALAATADEPDPLPQLQPVLARLHALLQQCRFPQFWALYRGDAVEALRDNYTVECVGFEDAVREVAVRAVKAAFTSIGRARLESYLALDGASFSLNIGERGADSWTIGPELDAYVAKLGWTSDASTGVITVPPNPDNQITSTVVQENIQLPRRCSSISGPHSCSHLEFPVLQKVITHAAQTSLPLVSAVN